MGHLHGLMLASGLCYRPLRKPFLCLHLRLEKSVHLVVVEAGYAWLSDCGIAVESMMGFISTELELILFFSPVSGVLLKIKSQISWSCLKRIIHPSRSLLLIGWKLVMHIKCTTKVTASAMCMCTSNTAKIWHHSEWIGTFFFFFSFHVICICCCDTTSRLKISHHNS